jgi:hypothetical protein
LPAARRHRKDRSALARIIHLSDLHLSEEFLARGPLAADQKNGAVADTRAIFANLCNALSRLDRDVSLIVVTGDGIGR